MAYLVARVHSAKLIKSEFDKVSSIHRHEARIKVEIYFKNKVIFTSTFNPKSQCPLNFESLFVFN